MANKKTIEVLRSSSERQFDAKETMKVLRANMLWLMSWGAKEFTTFGDDTTALFFKVSGRLHRGIVLITLGWDDTYTVRLLSSQWNEKAKFEKVYFDDLAELIDINVERVKEYYR